MDYYSYYLKDYYYRLYCIYMPSDNESQRVSIATKVTEHHYHI